MNRSDVKIVKICRAQSRIQTLLFHYSQANPPVDAKRWLVARPYLTSQWTTLNHHHHRWLKQTIVSNSMQKCTKLRCFSPWLSEDTLGMPWAFETLTVLKWYKTPGWLAGSGTSCCMAPSGWLLAQYSNWKWLEQLQVHNIEYTTY